MKLGIVADDFTGATDIASMLVRGGLRTVQLIGVPTGALPPAAADADCGGGGTQKPHRRRSLMR